MAELDPGHVRNISELKRRPFRELLARVGAASPRRVVHVGCGPGVSTVELVRRWPEAAVEGIDSDPEAVSMARKHGLTASVGFAARWAPGPGVDVVVCSGVLQAIPGHLAVLERWVRTLPAGAWVAVMLPNDFGAPSHVVAEELCEEPQWRPQLGGVLRAADVVRPPRVYAQRLAGLGCTVDAWESTYLPRMPVNDFMMLTVGTVLRPVWAALNDEDDIKRFHAELKARLRQAYPHSVLPGEVVGGAWMPFRRIFVVAQTPAARTSPP
jgi:trans-aconitate 2-methyltransferase